MPLGHVDLQADGCVAAISLIESDNNHADSLIITSSRSPRLNVSKHT
jgi:hypothetical protein